MGIAGPTLARPAPGCENPAFGGLIPVGVPCVIRDKESAARLAGLSWGGASMKLVPLGDKGVVKRLDAGEKTAGGILLPDAAQEKPRQGRVLSVGDGRLLRDGTRAKPQVVEGDRVLFDRFAGTEVVVQEEELLILNEDEILAVVA